MKEYQEPLDEILFLCHFAHKAKHSNLSTAEDISKAFNLDYERAESVAKFMKKYRIHPDPKNEPVFDKDEKNIFSN